MEYLGSHCFATDAGEVVEVLNLVPRREDVRGRRRGITQRVLDVGTTPKLTVSFLDPLTPEDKAPKIPHYTRLGGPQIRSIRFGKRKFFSFGNGRFLCRPACKVANILTELDGFSHKTPGTPLPAVLSSC